MVNFFLLPKKTAFRIFLALGKTSTRNNFQPFFCLHMACTNKRRSPPADKIQLPFTDEEFENEQGGQQKKKRCGVVIGAKGAGWILRVLQRLKQFEGRMFIFSERVSHLDVVDVCHAQDIRGVTFLVILEKYKDDVWEVGALISCLKKYQREVSICFFFARSSNARVCMPDFA